MEGNLWRKDDIRQQVVQQLRDNLEKYEGLGYLAEEIEKCCFAKSTSEKEYHKNLAKVLLERSDLEPTDKNCDICSFLGKVSSPGWKLLNQIEF